MDFNSHLLNVPEHLNDKNHYRKFISTVSRHSNYPLVYSLLSALMGSMIYIDDPIYGFVLYAWMFLVLYFSIINIYVFVINFLYCK